MAMLFTIAIGLILSFRIMGKDVDTDEMISFEKGTVRAEVPCRADISIYSVNWFKVRPDPQQPSLIIFMDLFANPGEKGGPGYEDGSFDIDGNYSLIIQRVEISNEGSYICEVASQATGEFFRNTTIISIFAPPIEPYPLITECIEGNQTGVDRNCSLVGSITNITCFVQGYYPTISLSINHGSKSLKTAESNETTNVDGTLDGSITVNVSASEQPYYCLAFDIPGDNSGDQQTWVLIQPLNHTRQPSQTAPNILAIVTPIVTIALIMVCFLVVYLVIYYKRGKLVITIGRETDLNGEALQEITYANQGMSGGERDEIRAALKRHSRLLSEKDGEIARLSGTLERLGQTGTENSTKILILEGDLKVLIREKDDLEKEITRLSIIESTA